MRWFPARSTSSVSWRSTRWANRFCRGQVWSLTQFYSVDFSQSRISVSKCVFYKRTIKVCVSCCWLCPGTSAPSAAHLTVSLYLCSSGRNAQGESSDPWRAPSQLKKPFKGPRRRWVAGKNRRAKYFPDNGCLEGKSMNFNLSGTPIADCLQPHCF